MKRDMINDPSFTYARRAVEDHFKTTNWYKNGAEMIDMGYPLQLELELNTDCNLRCPQCFQSRDPLKKEYLPLEKIKDLIDKGSKKGLESVKLQYRGEPLLYPHLIEVITYAKAEGLYVHFNTNATLLTKEMSINLIKAGLDKIVCSVDGCSKETYNPARLRGRFENVLRNITILQAQKQVLGSKTPAVRVQAVKQQLNKEEIESGNYVNFWSKRVEEVGIERCFDFYDSLEDATPLPDWHCEQLWLRLVILVDGRVLPCCAGINFGDNIIYSMGNIYKETVEQIWNKKRLKIMREAHKGGMSHMFSMCRKCRVRKLVIKEQEAEK